MDVFYHHIYEYNKGLRNLVLHTAPSSNRREIEDRLKKEGIPYLIWENGNSKINIFFGGCVCVEIVNDFGVRSLSDLSDEQDFMLGVMLGYDRLKQCERYLIRRGRKTDVEELIG